MKRILGESAVPDILVVDDNPANLQALVGMLKDRGYKARPVPSGELALEAARRLPPDLILLDINMPVMNGFEVCVHLKNDAALKDIPVIFLSALSDTDDKVKAFTVGGVDYITKPFRFEEVNARVSTHVQLRHCQVQIEQHNLRLVELVRAKVAELTDSQMATIMALSKLAEYRDEETGNHILRVQKYCQLLASRLSEEASFSRSIDAAFIDNIYHASPLHDIGKVATPDHILLSSVPLRKEDFEIMKRHAVVGANILTSVLERYPGNAFIKMGLEMARSHHEHWDGTGYPDGLKGEEIPLAARILIIVDQYDALRNVRPYKPPFSAEKTYKIITEGDGRTMPDHFDPRVLAAFKELFSQFEGICD